MNDDEFRITPEKSGSDALSEIIRTFMAKKGATESWSEDWKHISTAVCGRKFTQRICNAIIELNGLYFTELGREDSDEIELILMRMQRDAERVYKILTEYACSLDEKYFGKGEESE